MPNYVLNQISDFKIIIILSLSENHEFGSSELKLWLLKDIQQHVDTAPVSPRGTLRTLSRSGMAYSVDRRSVITNSPTTGEKASLRHHSTVGREEC